MKFILGAPRGGLRDNLAVNGIVVVPPARLGARNRIEFGETHEHACAVALALARLYSFSMVESCNIERQYYQCRKAHMVTVQRKRAALDSGFALLEPDDFERRKAGTYIHT